MEVNGGDLYLQSGFERAQVLVFHVSYQFGVERRLGVGDYFGESFISPECVIHVLNVDQSPIDIREQSVAGVVVSHHKQGSAHTHIAALGGKQLRHRSVLGTVDAVGGGMGKYHCHRLHMLGDSA